MRILLAIAALSLGIAPTVRASDNLARGAEVSVDSTYDGYTPAPLNDGIQIVASSEYWRAGWASRQNDEPHWVQLEWPRPVTAASVVVYWTLDGGQFRSASTVQARIRVNKTWQTVAESAPEPGSSFSVLSFTPVATTAIRILQPSMQGPADRRGLMWVAETEVYGAAQDAQAQGEATLSVKTDAGPRTARFQVCGGTKGGACDIRLGAVPIGQIAALPGLSTAAAVELVSPGGDAGELTVKGSGDASLLELHTEPTANSAATAQAVSTTSTASTGLETKPLHLDTLLVEAGAARVVIVSSSRQPSYAAIAAKVRDRIRAVAEVDVKIVDAETLEPETLLGSSNAIVLGNLVTSRFVEILYWEWYTIADLWYPGPGGHVLRTLHNPYGNGGNVVLLGGSDDAGVTAAADALCEALQPSEPLKVGRLMEIRLGSGHKLPPAGEWTDPRLRIFHETLEHANVHECPLGFTDASLAGLRYHYSGDEAAALRFRELALNTDILTNCYHYNAHMHPIIWDLIEESPVFSEKDRLAIVNKLLTKARGGDGTAGRDKLLNCAKLHRESKKILDRHDAMHANCTLTHSRYFNTYWPAEEWSDNLDAVRTYYDRSMTSSKGWRDEGNMHTYLECPIIASQLLRDARFVDSGALRHYAELLVRMTDNRGYHSTYGGSLDSTLRTCAGMLKAPTILATLPLRKETELATKRFPTPYGFLHGQAWAIGLEPVPAAELVGVSHTPLTRWCWEYYGKGFPLEKGLDKLSMRSGFGRNDQYLLLDGISVGGGKPCANRNSTLSFVQNGCKFLVGSTKTMRVSRGGVGAKGGQIVSLEGMADLPAFGYSHTRAADHAFSIWDRSIFWRKGKWFFFVDRVTAGEPGTYSIALGWSTRGGMKGAGRALEVSQGAGDAINVMHVKNGGLRGFDPGGGARETVLKTMDKGDDASFATLLYVSGGPAKMTYNTIRLGPSLFAITGDEDAYLGLLAGNSFDRAGIRIRGAAFCVSPHAVSVVSGRELRWDTLVVTASVPCGMELDPQTGSLTIEADRSTEITVGADTRSLTPGMHTFPGTATPPPQLETLTAAIRNDAAAQNEPVATDKQTDALPALPIAWTRKVGAYTSYCVADTDGSGSDHVLLGMADGRVLCLNDAGKTVWEHKLDGDIRAVACATTPAGKTIIAGSKNEHVYALTADGSKVLWKHKLHFSKAVHDRAPWWTEGGKATTKGILATDLDGDGTDEVVCGTGATFIEALTPDGRSMWMRQFVWGTPDRFFTAPAAGNTTSLLATASHASGCCIWRLAPDGKVLSKNALPSGRGSWDGTRTQQVVVADMDGKGTHMALVGRGGAFNEVGLHDAITGERTWQHHMADRVCAVVALDTDGDGMKEVIAGTSSAWLTAFDLTGKHVWATFMPAHVLAVTAIGDTLYVQCGDARIYRVSRDGQLTGQHHVASGSAPSAHQAWRLVHTRDRLFVPDRNGHATMLTVGTTPSEK